MRRCLVAALVFCTLTSAPAHDAPIAREEPTYRIDAAAEPSPGSPVLSLRILEETSGAPTPARFSISVDGKPYVPPALDRHGLRFTSIHTAKKQIETVLYARGTGPVTLSLPAGAREAEIVVAKGYEYFPQSVSFTVPAARETSGITVSLRRWTDLRERGWVAVDEHLHYERSDPAHDADWFTMLAGDGMDLGFFMVLDGGNLPGVWAEQYAYGERGLVSGLAGPPRQGGEAAGEGRVTLGGEAANGSNVTLVPGEEFRGTLQGHNNLHGIAEVITPITVGKGGQPRAGAGASGSAASHNWPASHDVITRVRESGGIGGAAHGGTFGKASTVWVDAILGASEFVELANTHLYELGPWYRLLNCGFLLPPVAGTDLPNYPYRGRWQPFFGETCTYVRVDDPATATFEDWKTALRRGRVFVTSGPLISLTIDGAAPGEPLRLPAEGKKIEIVAELASPLRLTELEVVRNGEKIPFEVEKSRDTDGVHRWTIRKEMTLYKSSWFAARGKGLRKNTLWAKSGVLQHSFAHTAPLPVFVGDEPIASVSDAETIVGKLQARRAVYAESGRFPDDAARARMLSLFDKAIEEVQRRSQPSP